MKARSKNLVSTAVLLAAAAGALAFAWYGIERKDEAVQAKKEVDARLFAFKKDAVKAVTVEAKGATTRVVREGTGWRVEAPLAAAAERSVVESLVEHVAALRRRAAVESKPDAAALARLGLTRPRVRVAVALDGGGEETLALGDENPFDGTIFVRTTSGAIDLVGGEARWPLEKDTFDLREKRLLPFEDKDVARLEVRGPQVGYALGREGETWKLLAPVAERADAAAADRVAGAVRGLRATAFEAESAEARRALARPPWRVTLTPAAGPARTLLLAPPFARLEGGAEVARVAPGVEKDLGPDLFALRDRRVLRFDREAVAAIRFSGGGRAFEAKKDAPGGKVTGVAWTLSTLDAKAFVDETGKRAAALGLDPAAREVTLLDKDGKELDRLLLSAERGGKLFARSASSPRVVEVDPAALKTLPASEADLAVPDAGGAAPAAGSN
jgi:hypothetical protein